MAKDKLAEAMAKYGEAAVVELIVSRLPEIMASVAKPMEQVDKITIIDNGGGQGGSKLSKIVTDVAANGFEVLKDLTGVDVSNILNNFATKNNIETKTSVKEVIENLPQDKNLINEVVENMAKKEKIED
ncbi:hypothetical protein SDC9_168695 [bioreactor metagenome]|uniref:Flotillin C-terminal domain-containing protein n=1 Tax=bioreactor metagenome TaxID=1076179 RepID=A0A645G5A9_9ZZZZ